MIHKIKKDLLKNFVDATRIENLKKFMNFDLEIRKYFGIGNNLIYILFRMLGFSNSKGIIHKFSYNFVDILENYIRKNFLIGDFYKRKLESEFKRYIELKTYKGFRFKYKLPARGQRTRVNSRTSRKLVYINVSNKFSKDIYALKENYSRKFIDREKGNSEKNIL